MANDRQITNCVENSEIEAKKMSWGVKDGKREERERERERESYNCILFVQYRGIFFFFSIFFISLQPRLARNCTPRKAAIKALFATMMLCTTKWTDHHVTHCSKFATKCAFHP